MAKGTRDKFSFCLFMTLAVAAVLVMPIFLPAAEAG